MNSRFTVGINQGVLRLGLVVALLAGGAWLVFSNQQPQADIASSTTTTSDNFFANRTISVTVQDDGRVLVGQQEIADTITRLKNSDELRVEILNGRKQPILGGNDIVIQLDSAVPLPSTQSMRAYGIHGADLVSEEPVRSSETTARWTLSQLSSEGSVSLVVNYAPQSFALGTRAWLRSLPELITWPVATLAGLIVWLLAALLMFAARRPWQIKNRAGGVIFSPPSALSPGAAGCLVWGKVGPAQLAATLVAMAARGDIQLVQSPAGYRVARRRAIPALSITEQILLNELRIGLKAVTNQESVEATIAQQLFNKKIADAYGGLLDELRQRGFFPQHQTSGRVWLRFLASCLVWGSIGGAILTTTMLPEGVRLIGFWIGPLLAGWQIFSRIPSLPRLNSVGQSERQRWLQFRNFLTDPTPLGGGQAEARAFLIHLPYAITFDVVPQWLARFNRDLIGIPDWYFNTDNPAASKVFIEDILTISSHIAHDFAKVAISE
jgi:hypothetical protein